MQCLETLATEIVNPALFAAAPQLLLTGMVSVLLTCGVWLQIATQRVACVLLPCVVGDRRFSCVAAGVQAIDWSILV